MEPFAVVLVAFKYSFRWSKVLLHQKGDKLFVCFFSRWEKNETFNYLITFSFILESHCGNICCLVASFTCAVTAVTYAVL